MYSKKFVVRVRTMIVSGNHDKKKSKGVSNRQLQKRIDFDDYKDCLLNEKIISLGNKTSKQQHQDKIYTSVSHNMKMYSVEQSKIALSW